jgi:hypothetical protein
MSLQFDISDPRNARFPAVHNIYSTCWFLSNTPGFSKRENVLTEGHEVKRRIRKMYSSVENIILLLTKYSMVAALFLLYKLTKTGVRKQNAEYTVGTHN